MSAAIAVVLVGQLIFIYLPVMNRIFESRLLTLLDEAVIIAIGVLLPLMILEVEKHLLRDRFDEE